MFNLNSIDGRGDEIVENQLDFHSAFLWLKVT